MFAHLYTQLSSLLSDGRTQVVALRTGSSRLIARIVNKSTLLAVTLILLMAPTAVLSQDVELNTSEKKDQQKNNSDKEKAEKEQASQDAEPDKKMDKKTSTEKSSDSQAFTPSEEISEDLSVAFPVDI